MSIDEGGAEIETLGGGLEAAATLVADLPQFSGYRTIAVVGAGGMGVVYSAESLATGKRVAIKVLRQSTQSGPSEARFSREVEILSRLVHPAIVSYVDHGWTTRGEPFLVMRWLEGEVLARRLTRGRLTLSETRALVARLCGALYTAHCVGVIHRDLKPENVFLEGGRAENAYLLDFGIARLADESATLTRTGSILGTPGYMSPEQARGERTDERTDIFSLGALLYECLSGRPPFAGSHVMAVLAKVLIDNPPRLDEVCTEISSNIASFIERMLEKDPESRPESVEAVARVFANGADLGTRGRTSVGRLTTDERIFVSVIFVRGCLARSIVAEVDRFFATLAQMVDGTIVLTLRERGGSPGDRAVLAADLALAVRGVAPTARQAVSSGFCRLQPSTVVEELLDRGADALQRCDKGEIVIDDVSSQLLAERYLLRVDERGTFITKRRAAERAVRVLLGRPAPFVERRREMAILSAFWEEATHEAVPSPVLVTGDAGSGKSRLRFEFLAALEKSGDTEPTVVMCRCKQIGGAAAYATLASGLRRNFGIFDGEAPDSQRAKISAQVQELFPSETIDPLVDGLGILTGAADHVTMHASVEPTHLFEMARSALLRWFEALSATAPVLLIIEDLHWGDAPSMKLLDAVLASAGELRLMILALARPDVRVRFPALWDGRGIQEVRLQPLSARGARRLVEAALGKEVEPTELTSLIDMSSGNPFFLEELVRAVAQGGVGVRPVSALAMMTERIMGLSRVGRVVLRAASVVGEVFWTGTVRALVGPGVDVEEVLSELAASEWITSRPDSRIPREQEYVFRHALVADAAYETLTTEDRVRGHRLAAEWLCSANVCEPRVLARHYSLSDTPDRARVWYLQSAKQALEASDFGEAIELAEAALPLEHASDRVICRRVLAESHNFAGRYTEAERWANLALGDLPPRTDDWFGVQRIRAEALGRTSRNSELGDLLDTLAAGDGLLGEQHLRALATGVNYLVKAGELRRALSLMSIVRERCADMRSYSARVQQDYFTMRTNVADEIGDLGAALRLAKLALRAALQVRLEAEVLHSRMHLAHVLCELGRDEEASREYEEVIRRARRFGMRTPLVGALCMRGRLAQRAGRWGESGGLYEEALSLTDGENPRFDGSVCVFMAERLHAMARDRDAREYARKAEALLRVAPPLHAYALAVLGLCTKDDAEAALFAVRSANDILERIGTIAEFEIDVHLATFEVLQRLGRADARGALVRGVETLRRRLDSLEDAELRRSMVERVPACRDLIRYAEDAGLAWS